MEIEFGFETGYPENKSHSSEIEILLVIRYFLAMGEERPYGGASINVCIYTIAFFSTARLQRKFVASSKQFSLKHDISAAGHCAFLEQDKHTDHNQR